MPDECKFCGHKVRYREQCGRCGYIIVRLKEFLKLHKEVAVGEFRMFLEKAGMRNLPDEFLISTIIDRKLPELRPASRVNS